MEIHIIIIIIIVLSLHIIVYYYTSLHIRLDDSKMDGRFKLMKSDEKYTSAQTGS